MNLRRFVAWSAAVCVGSYCLLWGANSDACTGITLHPADGSVITGRTLEFAKNTDTRFIIIPRGTEYTGTAPGGQPGLKWTTKYGAVGANAAGVPQLIDGINERGLSVGLFWFPAYAQYQDVSGVAADHVIGAWELGTYLLTTAASADEAVQKIQQIRVGPAKFPAWSMVVPAHYRISDSTGRSFVLEYVGGKPTIYENPLGVMSNAPTFDWHLTNLRNYMNLFTGPAPVISLGEIKLTPFGQGSGMHGLPGDFSPPSRFVRAVAFSQTAVPSPTAADGVQQTFHLLNQFDLPKGLMRDKDADGKEIPEYTQWTSVSDLTNRRYYYRTYDDQQIRMIDLEMADFLSPGVKTVPVEQPQPVVDMTSLAQ